MPIRFEKRQVFATEDGSTSLKLADVDEQYHSVHGAWNESTHIYIHNGLRQCLQLPQISILECGFGTGLNAILTYLNTAGIPVRYDTVEAYPLSMEEVRQLNFAAQVTDFPSDIYKTMHQAESGKSVQLQEGFQFTKTLCKLEDCRLENGIYDLVYYDMFNPAVQPELWTEENFVKLRKAMKPGAKLLTYCAKGSVKRALRAAGFSLEALPGPVGKREITRATSSLDA